MSRDRLQGGVHHLTTSRGAFIADQVVVATGGSDSPILPPYAAQIDTAIPRMHSRHTRRASQLPKAAR